MTAFEEFGVLPEIGKAVDEMEWTLPTDVQAEAIPLILGGGDVLMAAETGSGKTGAFCLPILQIVWETLKDISEGKCSKVLQQTSGKWIMSFFDRGEAFAVTPDGMRCQSREFKAWHGCRASKGVFSKGAYYYEVTVTDEGLCRVGWSTQQACLDLGTDRFGYGFGGTGKKSNNKQFDDYGEAFGINDTIGCLLNLNNGEVRFTKNGEDLDVAFTLNSNQRQACYFPAVVLKNAEVLFNFGATPFKYTMPAGYVAVSLAPAEVTKSNSVTGVGPATSSKPSNNAPQAIIIEPSRELAEQTFNQIIKFKKYLDVPKVRELLVIGGVNVKDQISVLNSGVDIVVGTPGRMEDLIQGGYLSLTQCRFFVLDEADGLLKSGYGKMIERLHHQIPKITSDGRRLQMVVCSATLHAFEVKSMAEKLMHFPTWVDLKGEDAVPETVHHCVVNVDPQTDRSWERLQRHIQTDAVHARDNVRGNTAEALSEAVKILKGEYCIRAIREHKMDRALIFCRTKVDCDNLERYFNQSGNDLSCVCLHGDRKPQERKGNLEKFKAGAVKFMICTDVAARGIDINGLPFMINVTLPDEKSNYVHRIGRVGRAERMGLAISLVATVPEKVWYHGEWCSSRGRNCSNTNLTDVKGCCMWYNEPRYIGEIEEHLNVTIQQIETDMKVPCNDFDGKVVYGEKKLNTGSGYKDHVSQMVPVVKLLSELESSTQICYLKMHHNLQMALIFCRTKVDCDNLERYFNQSGNDLSCVCLHGDRKPQERKGNLEKFKAGAVKFMICTDVAARGIDINGLPFMINVTLPDEKSNYVHRIGRVGRAERMGLAISLVATVPEKVWYHGEWCSSRGRNCSNTNLTDVKGCCMWYNEPRYIGEIEEHLNVTIQQIETDMKVPCNDFDGKVVYGEKKLNTGSGYKDHVSQMVPVVKLLSELESSTQICYLKMHHNLQM